MKEKTWIWGFYPVGLTGVRAVIRQTIKGTRNWIRRRLLKYGGNKRGILGFASVRINPGGVRFTERFNNILIFHNFLVFNWALIKSRTAYPSRQHVSADTSAIYRNYFNKYLPQDHERNILVRSIVVLIRNETIDFWNQMINALKALASFCKKSPKNQLSPFV